MNESRRNKVFTVIKQNKKSIERGVAPAGIKSHKFLFELKTTMLQYSNDWWVSL